MDLRFSFFGKKNYFCNLKQFNAMATTADIKNGMCIELDGKTFSIVEFLHVKPGKGPAFVRTKLMTAGETPSVLQRFRTG